MLGLSDEDFKSNHHKNVLQTTIYILDKNKQVEILRKEDINEPNGNFRIKKITTKIKFQWMGSIAEWR